MTEATKGHTPGTESRDMEHEWKAFVERLGYHPEQVSKPVKATAYAAVAQIDELRKELRASRRTLDGINPATVKEIIAAATAFESDLSEYCDGPKRERLRAALAKLTKKE